MSCSLAVLASCSVMDDWQEGITGERAEEQVVQGPRRVPPLNNRAMMSHIAPPPMVEKVPAAAVPPAAVATPPAPEAEVMREAPAPASVVDEPAGDRKPFIGNPRYSSEAQFTAPGEVAAVPAAAPSGGEEVLAQLSAPVKYDKVASSVSKAPPAPAPKGWSKALSADDLKSATDEIIAQPVEPQTAQAETNADADSGPGFFARLGESMKQPFAAKPAAESAKDENVSYPELSSVPQTPSQMQDAKNDSEDKIGQLISAHEAAQQSRQELESEPSEFAPVPLTTETASGKAAETPVVAPVAVRAPAPEEKPVAEKMTVEKTTQQPEKKSSTLGEWLGGISLFGAKDTAPVAPAEDTSIEKEAEGAPQEIFAAPVNTPLNPQQLENTPEPLQPLRSASGEELPTLSTTGAPVAPVVAVDEEGESAPEGLPSSESMQKIRLLAPSRYTNRSGAGQ